MIPPLRALCLISFLAAFSHFSAVVLKIYESTITSTIKNLFNNNVNSHFGLYRLGFIPSWRQSSAIELSPRRPSRTMRIFYSVENLRRVLRRISLTAFSVFDMLMMILLYFSLKVADVSLSGSGHLVPWWLTPHTVAFYNWRSQTVLLLAIDGFRENSK